MQRLRETKNPLDRDTRNDINYNWKVIDKTIEIVETQEATFDERFTNIENDVTKINKKQSDLEKQVNKNTQKLEETNIDEVWAIIDTVKEQGNTAKIKGDKAQTQGTDAENKGKVTEQQGVVAKNQGNTAKSQGDYAKTQGDFAKEKGQLAQNLTVELEKANKDLPQLKADTIVATASANNEAKKAKEVTDKGLPMLITLERDLPKIDNLEHKGEYLANAQYKRNNEVLYHGSTYRAKEDVKGVVPTTVSKWLLVSSKGLDGEGAVSTVNGIEPDSKGNVTLDLDYAKQADIDNVLTTSKAYTDAEIKKIPSVDLTPYAKKTDLTPLAKQADVDASIKLLETKSDASKKLSEAKAYTDSKVSNVDVSKLETKADATKKLADAKAYTDTGFKKIDYKYDTMDARVYSNELNIQELLKRNDLVEGRVSKLESNGGGSGGSGGVTESTVRSIAKEEVSRHANLRNNPHNVTASQLGIDTGGGGGGGGKIENIEQTNVTTSGSYGTAFGNSTKATAQGAFAAGKSSEATAYYTIAMGNSAMATVNNAIAVGVFAKANGQNSLALGQESETQYSNTVAIGGGKANKVNAMALKGIASGDNSVSVGHNSSASADFAVGIGYESDATGQRSIAIGQKAESRGAASVAIGEGTLATGMNQTALGYYNSTGGSSDPLIVGSGSGANYRQNAMRLDEFGNMYVRGKYNTGGADYAEMFEWEDGNVNNEDRRGLAVTYGNGETVKLANANDEVIGIVSDTASIIGNNPDEWNGMYLTDDFENVLYEEKDIDGTIKSVPVLNPLYDDSKDYIPRNKRQEWATVGMLGKLILEDDGTCVVNGYAKISENGIATKGTKTNGYRVVKRISEPSENKRGLIKVVLV